MAHAGHFWPGGAPSSFAVFSGLSSIGVASQRSRIAGIGAWAAGSAARMPPLAAIVPSYIDCVTVFADDDKEGRRHASELAGRIRDRGFEARLIIPNKVISK